MGTGRLQLAAGRAGVHPGRFFDIKVRGQFVPQLQRHVFASQDGIAEKVYVTHDQAVQSGELLIELSSTALDLEFQRISGEMGVARTELMAIRTEQLQAPEFDARHLQARVSDPSSEQSRA